MAGYFIMNYFYLGTISLLSALSSHQSNILSLCSLSLSLWTNNSPEPDIVGILVIVANIEAPASLSPPQSPPQ